jgi:hypothetical protein
VELERVVRRLSVFSRLGYATRGVVYLLVGSFATMAALTARWQTADQRGVLVELLDERFGELMLAGVSFGLVAYSAWRLVQAVLDADDHGRSLRGLAVRAGLLVSAVAHLLLAVSAASLLFGWGEAESGESGIQRWTGWLLSQTLGQWFTGAVGVLVIGAGLAHVHKAWTAGFEKFLDDGRPFRAWQRAVSRFGLAARGGVFVAMGGFLIVAAIEFSSREAHGLKGALDALQRQPYGWVLLGLVGLGLLAFGIYSLIEAVYRRIGLAGKTAVEESER